MPSRGQYGGAMKASLPQQAGHSPLSRHEIAAGRDKRRQRDVEPEPQARAQACARRAKDARAATVAVLSMAIR